MKLYFVRHGESEANVLRVISNRRFIHGLTERGRLQAAALAAELLDANMRRIYSSPLLRATQTAEILSQRTGVPMEITDALREFDCGIAEGRADETAWAMHQTVIHEWFENKNWDARIEQGESFNDMRLKFVPFIERVLRENAADDNVVFVMHGGIIICMLPLILCNVDSQFAFANSRGQTNARYILAETTATGLMCRSWFGIDVRPNL